MDEAHNLQRACSNLNSDRVTLGTLRSALRELNEIQTSGSEGLKEFLRLMNGYLFETLKSIGEEEVEFDVKGCIERCGGDVETFRSMIQEMRRLGTYLRRVRMEGGGRPDPAFTG